MKQLLFFFLLTFSLHVQAQFVNIPDINFRNKLMNLYPSCFNASQEMDTTCNAIVNTTNLDLHFLFITDLEGIQYFDNLQILWCSNNQLTSLSNLPGSLLLLDVRDNLLNSLGPLPMSITQLLCNGNQLTSLPSLPNGLTQLWCHNNQLSSLPTLPNTLTEIYCFQNNLTSLPTIPNSVITLLCQNNQLSSFPTLSNTLGTLACSYNQFTSLSSLPNSITSLTCDHNQLSNLASLPSSLSSLDCSYNLLTTLPVLPSSLGALYCNNNLLTSLPALNTSLGHLNCSNNQLSNLPALPGPPYFLSELRCSNNLLTSLPSLINYNSLSDFSCDSNLLTSLPDMPYFLINVTCSHNQLTSLPYFPNNNLQTLNCDDNQLSALPVLSYSLKNLSCRNNFLTSLPDLMITDLNKLNCDGNLLTNLPSLPPFLYKLSCTNMPLLDCLPLIPNQLDSLFTNNTGISCIPNIPFGLTTTLPLCSSGSMCEPHPNISGKIFNDINYNGTYEYGIDSLLEAWVVSGSAPWSASSNVNGNYQLLLDSGVVNTYSLNPLNNYTNIIPPNYSLTPFAPGSQGYNNDFAVQFIPNINDLRTDLAAGPARPGFNQWVSASVNNIGTTNIANATLKVLKPNAFTLISATPAISTQIGDTLIWNNININLLQYQGFNVLWNIPSTMSIGTPYQIESWIESAVSDSTPMNNYALHDAFIVGSFDPNDKQVSNTNVMPTALGNELEYTIRFQNTGTDTAFNIIVRDSLSSKLDISTFRMIGASHNYSFVIRDSNLLEVFFPNILLVDSNTNEPASHGFFQYAIKPKSSLVIGDMIKNTAGIYFDYNAPVITNTVTTSIGIGVSTVEIAQADFELIPNPTNGKVIVRMNETSGLLRIIDINGKTIREQMIQNGSIVDFEFLRNGLYFAKMETNKGSKMVKIIKQN